MQSYPYVIHVFHLITKTFERDRIICSFVEKRMKDVSSIISLPLEVLMSSGVSKDLVMCRELSFLCEIKFYALVLRIEIRCQLMPEKNGSVIHVFKCKTLCVDNLPSYYFWYGRSWLVGIGCLGHGL